MKAIVAMRIAVTASVNVEFDKDGFNIVNVEITNLPISGCILAHSSTVRAHIKDYVDEKELVEICALNTLRAAEAHGQSKIAASGLQESLFDDTTKVGQA